MGCRFAVRLEQPPGLTVTMRLIFSYHIEPYQSYWAEELFSRAFVCIKLDNLKQEGTLVFRRRQTNNQPEA
jgi:hypothetical protein